MIKPEQIPKEVVEAAAKVLHANAEVFHDILWDDLGEYDQDAYREEATSALLAGLNAWPQMHLHEWQRPWLGGMSGTDIILPLPEAPQGRIAKQEEAGDV